MKICFFGSGNIAVKTANYLLQEKIELAKIISGPEKKSGRGWKIQPSPLRLLAEKFSIDYETPKNFEDLSFLPPCPFFVVVNYGKILPKPVLDLPQIASLNIHFSLLPKWRGASPVRAALQNGDAWSGISIMKMTERLDAGDILAQKKVPITKTTHHENLTQELIFLGCQELVRVLKNYASIQPIPQEEEKATYSFKTKKGMTKIDWQKPAQNIYWLYQAMSPRPSIFSYWKGKKIFLKKIRLAETNKKHLVAGKILTKQEGKTFALEVAAAKGSLWLDEVQMENKKQISAEDWWNGYRINLTEKFQN